MDKIEIYFNKFDIGSQILSQNSEENKNEDK